MRRSSLKLFALLIVLCLSCSSPCRQWDYMELDSCGYCSRRIVLYPDQAFRGLQLEFVKTRSGCRAYLKINSLAFPCCVEEKSQAIIVLAFQESSQEFHAYRLEGGQCLLLPLEAQEAIISQLLDGKTVTISVGRYKSEIIPRGFCNAYRQFSLHQMSGI